MKDIKPFGVFSLYLVSCKPAVREMGMLAKNIVEKKLFSVT